MFDYYDFKERYKLFGLWKALYYTIHGFRVFKFCRKVIYFAQKLYAYLPIIWHDGDSDFSYLLTLMEFKMRRMGDHIIEHDIIVSAPKIGQELKLAAELCKRIREDNYAAVPLAKLDAEYGELSITHAPTEDANLKELIIDRVKAPRGTAEYELVKKKERKIFDQARAQRERDKEYLFNLMNKRIDFWWD